MDKTHHREGAEGKTSEGKRGVATWYPSRALKRQADEAPGMNPYVGEGRIVMLLIGGTGGSPRESVVVVSRAVKNVGGTSLLV